MALSAGAGCPMAWRTVEDIKAHMDRVCVLTLPAPDAMLPLVEQHRAIIAAIDAQDPDRAEQAMRHHLSADPARLAARGGGAPNCSR